MGHPRKQSSRAGTLLSAPSRLLSKASKTRQIFCPRNSCSSMALQHLCKYDLAPEHAWPGVTLCCLVTPYTGKTLPPMSQRCVLTGKSMHLTVSGFISQSWPS